MLGQYERWTKHIYFDSFQRVLARNTSAPVDPMVASDQAWDDPMHNDSKKTASADGTGEKNLASHVNSCNATDPGPTSEHAKHYEQCGPQTSRSNTR